MSQEKKEIRRRFREEVFKRDGLRCKWCEKKVPNVDHLKIYKIAKSTLPNNGLVKENGISLCGPCYNHLEHLSDKLFEELLKLNDYLFKLIDSTWIKAHKKSSEL